MLEKLHQHFASAQIDICVRKGNESLFDEHPFIGQVHIWDKINNKFKNLWSLSKRIKKEKYDVVVNLQRFASSGLLTVRSGAKEKIGFKKNPLSLFFTRSFEHEISSTASLHEVERNQKLIVHLTDRKAAMPKLYPSKDDFAQSIELANAKNYITISPASVWFTKQLPIAKWVSLINKIKQDTQVFILGGPRDEELGKSLITKCEKKNIENLAGSLSLLGSAALMQSAQMNYVNDSAPLHLCSALNAPVTAFFCSTVPAFGFTPLSDHSIILETKEHLDCRPCGLHGFKECPKGHFKCGEIELP